MTRLCIAGFEPYTYLLQKIGTKTKHRISNFSKKFLEIKKARLPMICTPKVRHFWRCIFLWQEKEQYNKSIVQNSK